MPQVLVLLDRDSELVPGRTKAQLRAIAQRTEAAKLTAPAGAVMFDGQQAEDGIVARQERKAAAAIAA